MRNVCIFFLLSIIISLTALGLSNPQPSFDTSDYLRIHIRANSNSACDQAVKYEVKDEIVTALTPVVAGCESKAQAVSRIRAQTGNIQALTVYGVRGFRTAQPRRFGKSVSLPVYTTGTRYPRASTCR